MCVSTNDVSSVIRLIREVCDLWDDPPAWREQLLHGACHLVDGHVGIMLEDDDSAAYGYFGNLEVTSVVGLSPTLQGLVQPAISQMAQRQYGDVSENVLPGLNNLWDQMQRQGWVTTAGNQIADEASYHASPFYRGFRSQIDCDDFVVSIRVVDLPRRPEGIMVDRPHGAPPFGPREVAIMKLLHDEIAPLVGVRLTTEEQLSRDGLSKRLRETLSLLLEGYSEKQVASELNLGVRTVHDYVTMLYQHFQVSSRAELLAYFIRRTPASRKVSLGNSD
ncbi:MAG TPA: LuxR C-terminal-related transcriptional regulator [Lacipirellulaceae bacterium]|jgi:DNA-binding CsgD family transcriptional regulator